MKKILLGIIIGGIVFGSIGVFAGTYMYQAKDVTYNDTNVQDAIDELYSKVDSGVIKSFVITSYKGGGAHGVNADGAYWNDSSDSYGYMKAITQSDIISAARTSYGNPVYQCTVLKSGYYLTNNSFDITYYQVGDSFSLNSGNSNGGIGTILYFGENNPYN